MEMENFIITISTDQKFKETYYYVSLGAPVHYLLTAVKRAWKNYNKMQQKHEKYTIYVLIFRSAFLGWLLDLNYFYNVVPFSNLP